MNQTQKLFQNEDGIYVSKKFDDSTNLVKSFYKHHPFPNYQGKENKAKLIELKNNNNFLKNIIDDIGYGKDVIEIGSGTSQLSNLIAATSNNRVVAFDATYESLMMGKKFSLDNQINNCSFVQGDISEINSIFPDEKFDYLICSGVLHHTADPYGNFNKILKLLKNNGIVVLGLYNIYGRIYSKTIKYLYRLFGEKILSIFDPVYSQMKISKEQKKSWVNDQYHHPIESCHSFREVFQWFDENQIQTINTIPPINEKYFDNKSLISMFNNIAVEIGINFSSLGKDGGLFVFSGKKCKKE